MPVVVSSSKEDRIPALFGVDSVPDLTKEEVDEITAVGEKIHFRHYKVSP